MLTVYFGEKDDSIFRISKIFNNGFNPEWFDKEDVKKMVLDIDKSIVMGNRVIENPILGLIPPSDLSTGVKALILMAHGWHSDNEFFDGDLLGDNCVPWLYEIAQTKDINITLTHILDFKRVEKLDGFNIHIENDGRTVTSYWEFIMAYIDFKEEMG